MKIFFALRLRLVNDNDNSFSFKKVFYTPLNKNKFYVEEIETKFPFTRISDFKNIFERLQIEYNSRKFRSGQELVEFMRTNNYYDDQIMSKVRQVFVMNDNEMVIDNVDKVGTIIELECKNDDPLVIIKTILNDDEWERSVEGTSYMWLKNVKGLTSHISNFKSLKKVPDGTCGEMKKNIIKKFPIQIKFNYLVILPSSY